MKTFNGLEQRYEVVKTVVKKLILNYKVVDFLYEELTKDKREPYVYFDNATQKHFPITKELINNIINNNGINKSCLRILEEYPEYEDCPYKVEHPSPYNHRWEGDYDESAYDDYKILTYSLEDILYGEWFNEPLYIKQKNRFDWTEEVVVEEKANR